MLDASCAKLPRIMILNHYFFFISHFVSSFLLSKCYLLFVVIAAFRLAHRQAGSGMNSTAFAVAVDCASMMTEMLLLLL